MADFQAVLRNVLVGQRTDEQLYNRIFVVSAYGGMTDKLLEQGRATTDPQHKKALMRQAHRQIAADHTMAFLWTLDSYAAMSTRVRSVTIHPFYFFSWASDWTLAR